MAGEGSRRGRRVTSARAVADQVTKLERLLNLVALFFAAREPVPFSEIVGRVAGYDDDAAPDAHEKRFVRDRADLAALGVETEFVSDGAGGGGYRVAAERTFLRRTVFTEADAAMLSVAARAGGAALGGGPLADALRGALRKLAADLPASAPPSACDEPSAPLNVTVVTPFRKVRKPPPVPSAMPAAEPVVAPVSI